MPNAGFLEDAVFEDPAFLQSCQSDQCASDQQNVVEGESVGEVSSKLEAKPGSDRNDDQEQLAADVAQLKVTGAASDEASNAEEQSHMSVEDVDALLDKCLLQALHTTVKDKDLPMPGSTLW